MPFCSTTLDHSITFHYFKQGVRCLKLRVLKDEHRYYHFTVIIVSFSGLSHLSGLQVCDAANLAGHYNFGHTVSANPSNNSPCWDSPTPKLPFTFSIYPNRLAQCEQTRIYWNADEVQG